MMYVSLKGVTQKENLFFAKKILMVFGFKLNQKASYTDQILKQLGILQYCINKAQKFY